MCKIKIINGNYGLHTKCGVNLKTRNSEPFCVDESEAKRLVDSGIAEYVDEPVVTKTIEKKTSQTTNNTKKKQPANKGNKNTKKSSQKSKGKKEEKTFDNDLVLTAADPV